VRAADKRTSEGRISKGRGPTRTRSGRCGSIP